MDEEYDCIVLGTGLTECILSGYLLELSLKRRSIQRFVIKEKAPTMAFSWLKVATIAFTLKKTLVRHYVKWVLTHSR